MLTLYFQASQNHVVISLKPVGCETVPLNICIRQLNYVLPRIEFEFVPLTHATVQIAACCAETKMAIVQYWEH